MSLLRFLGIRGRGRGRRRDPRSLVELEARLESLPPEESRFVAAFAYLLARIAGADLRFEDTEQAEMARRIEHFGGVDAEQAKLLAEHAVHMAEMHSSSDDHLVARAFGEMSSREERLKLLRCLYAVAAADDNISTREDNEIFEVGRTIGASREDVVALRAEFRAYLGSLKALPTER